MAKANPVRFSTKYKDDESDLLYYGYRYYKASTGTWLGRDPLTDQVFYEEYVKRLHSDAERQWLAGQALNNPYMFELNDPVDKMDGDGSNPIMVTIVVGRLISSGIMLCYNCHLCYDCIRNTRHMVLEAGNRLSWDQLVSWATAAKPGQECVGPCLRCGENFAELVILVVRAAILN